MVEGGAVRHVEENESGTDGWRETKEKCNCLQSSEESSAGAKSDAASGSEMLCRCCADANADARICPHLSSYHSRGDETIEKSLRASGYIWALPPSG